MKKILSMILALAMILSLGVTAFAAETTGSWDGTTANGTQQNVTAKYTAAGEDNVTHVHSVLVSWNIESTLVYNAGTKSYTWNTTDLKWDSTDTKGWAGSATVNVTITNRSSQAIKATVTDEAKVTGADIQWTKDSAEYANTELEIGTAATDDYGTTGTAPSVTLVGTIAEGSVTGEIDSDNATVATITVTLSK